MAQIGTTLSSTRCKFCGAITFVAGYDTCETCLTSDTHYIPISAVADVIVKMDQVAMSPADRAEYFTVYFITPTQVEAAEEEVEARYSAARMKRNRSRRW